MTAMACGGGGKNMLTATTGGRIAGEAGGSVDTMTGGVGVAGAVTPDTLNRAAIRVSKLVERSATATDDKGRAEIGDFCCSNDC